MTFHDLKDIVMIYSSDQNGKPDYSWDKAKIKVWNPHEQQEMDLIFTGSNRGDKPEDFNIHFTVNYKGDRKDVFDAYDATLKKIFPNIEDKTLKEYRKVFMGELVNIRRK